MLTSIATLLLLVAASEGYVRATRPMDLGEELRPRIWALRDSTHPELSYELLPGAQGFAWGAEISISSQGLRDREYEVPKPPGVLRIAVIGDSVTFGNQLPEEATYVRQLEGLLASESIEVLNLGVGGYDAVENVARLEHVGLGLEPDVVLFGYCVNDAGVHSINRSFMATARRLRWAVARLHLVQLVLRRVDKRAALAALEVENEERVFARRHAERIVPVAHDPHVAGHLAWMEAYVAREQTDDLFLLLHASASKLGRLRHSLERFARLAELHGFEPRLVLLPYLARREHPDAWQRVSELLRHECERVGIAYLDPHARFDAMPEGALQMSSHDHVHFDAAGHRMLAEELADWFAPLLPAR